MIAFKERISFEEITIESNSDVWQIAKQWNQEELYELYLFIDALTIEESAELFNLFLENI